MTKEIIKDCVFCENGRTCNIYPWTCDYDGYCSSNEECPIKKLKQENENIINEYNKLQEEIREQLKRFEQVNKDFETLTKSLYKRIEELEKENEALAFRERFYKADYEASEQENKELKSQRDEARIAYNNLILDIVSDIPFEGEIGGERFISIKDRLHQMQKALASLEEIRVIADDTFKVCDDDCGNARKIKLIIDKINEVLTP